MKVRFLTNYLDISKNKDYRAGGVYELTENEFEFLKKFVALEVIQGVNTSELNQEKKQGLKIKGT